MLCIDEIHTLGVPNYMSPLLNIRVLGFGKEGIESINRISRFNLDNIYISGICVSEQDLNNLNAGNSILLESNKNGSITADCIIKLESIARSADIIMLMLDPNKIDGLEGQALGFLGESYALRICALLGEKSYNTLMVKLLSNGMDAIMPCTISDESYRLVYKLIDTLGKFPIYKETLSQVDFYEIKMFLKNSGVIQTAWEKSSGLNRCINAAAKCLSIVDKINVLSLDNSIKAKAQLKDSNTQLTEKDEAIADKQHQHTIDLRKQNLNDQLDSYQTDINAKKDAEDEKYDAEKDRLDELKEETEKYWEDQINNERKWATLKQHIMSGTLKTVQSDFSNFTKILNNNLTTIGQSITNNLIDKMKNASTLAQSTINDINNISGNNSNFSDSDSSTNTDNPVTQGMLLTTAGQLAHVTVEWKNGVYYINGKGFGASIPGTHVDTSNRTIVDNPELIKRILENFGGTFHEGGIVSGSNGSSSLLQKVNALFNLKPNERIVKSLVDELQIPKINVFQNFIPNLQNMISSITPQVAVEGGGNVTYNMNVHIDKVENSEQGVDGFFKKINKGMEKLGK
jgi:hypothetical protein